MKKDILLIMENEILRRYTPQNDVKSVALAMTWSEEQSVIYSEDFSRKKTVKYAKELFSLKNGMGWAEAVFLAVSKATGKDGERISHIASGFQGGMGTGEVCGAVSGGIMAIGLLYGQEQPEAANHLAREFVRGFEEKNGAVRCIDLIGFDIASANLGEDISSAKDLMVFFAKGGKRICNKAVSSAVELLLEQLEEWDS